MQNAQEIQENLQYYVLKEEAVIRILTIYHFPQSLRVPKVREEFLAVCFPFHYGSQGGLS